MENYMEDLKFLIECGIINRSSIQEQREMAEKKKYLDMHQYKIFESGGKWYTYLPGENGKRIQVKRNTRKEIEQEVVKFYREKEFNPTVEEIYNEWNEYRIQLGQIKLSTKDRNDDFYKRHFEEMGKRKVANITPGEWGEFLETQVYQYQLTAKAYGGLKQIVYGLLQKAKKRGLINYSISEIKDYTQLGKNSFRRPNKQVSKEVFNEEETERIINYLKDNLDTQNLGILLMFVTGMRVGEVATLKKQNIGDNFIVVESSETRHRTENGIVYEEGPAKTTESEREIAIPEGCEWITKRLQELFTNSDYVFVNKNGRMTTNCFRNRLQRVCKRLEITPKSPHKIRKTYASMLIDSKLNKNLTISQMGHTNIGTTEEHYYRDRINIDKKSQILGEIKGFNSLKEEKCG